MVEAYPKFVRSDEKDPKVWKPLGWKGNFYRIFSSLRFSRNALYLSKDLFMVVTELSEGQIKVGGTIENGGLTIGFSESIADLRISGESISEQKVAISYNGCKWDALIKAPVQSVTIYFSPDLTELIVSEDAHSFLMEAKPVAGERHSLLAPITPMGEVLRKAIRSSIRLAEEADGLLADESLQWISDDLVSMARDVIDQITEQPHTTLSIGDANKYAIARDIEKLLWLQPSDKEPTPTSLDEFAKHFGYSKRLIQMAIQDHFGVGFLALKRCIRLHQANAALSKGADNVASVAFAYEFQHLGRFAQYYKEMYGVLPSKVSRKQE